MTYDEQVRLWLDGKSIHDGDENQCCPDFSCCRPEFQASKKERERFAYAHFEGDEKTTTGMLMAFLGRALRVEFGDKVHVVGDTPSI